MTNNNTAKTMVASADRGELGPLLWGRPSLGGPLGVLGPLDGGGDGRGDRGGGGISFGPRLIQLCGSSSLADTPPPALSYW
jgi:hypothetical protein